MKPFCDIDAYQRRYGEVDDPATVYELLMDATRELMGECERYGIDWRHQSAEYKDRLMQVCRSMAARALSASQSDGLIPYGATQITTTADSFTEYASFSGGPSNGYGDMYLTKSERRMLGFVGGRVYTADVYVGVLGHGRCKH